MNPLQQIPPGVRMWLYWGGWLAGTVGQGVSLVWAAIAADRPDIEMPLAMVIVSAVLAFLTTQLHLLAGVNTHPDDLPSITVSLDEPDLSHGDLHA